MRTYEIVVRGGLKRVIRNPVEEVIYDVLGGQTPAAEALKWKRQTVHYVVNLPRLRDADIAEELAAAAARAGRPVPAEEILELKGHPWRGPDRHADGAGRSANGRNGSRSRSQRREGGAVSPAASLAHAREKARGDIRALHLTSRSGRHAEPTTGTDGRSPRHTTQTYRLRIVGENYANARR